MLHSCVLIVFVVRCEVNIPEKKLMRQISAKMTLNVKGKHCWGEYLFLLLGNLQNYLIIHAKQISISSFLSERGRGLKSCEYPAFGMTKFDCFWVDF